MERDERLLPIPNAGDLQPASQDYPSSYPTAYEEDVFNSDGRSIREYFNVVYKRLPIILALTILTTAVVAFYMYRIPTQYEASAQLLIEKPKKEITENTIYLGPDMAYYNTQIKLLNSSDLMNDVVIRLGLYKNPDLFKNQNKGITQTIKSIFSGDNNNPENGKSLQVIGNENNINEDSEQIRLTPEEKIRAKQYAATLKGGLQAEQVERTQLVNITMRGQNAVLVAKVADGVAETFMEQDFKRQSGFDEKNLKDITKTIEGLRKTISDQEQELLAIMQNGGLPVTSGEVGGANPTASLVSSISAKWFEALDDLRRAEAKYNTVLKSKTTRGLDKEDRGPEIDIEQAKIDRKAKLDETLRGYDKQISDLETELSDLLVRYTEGYVKVRQVRAKIDELKKIRVKAEKDGEKLINTDISTEKKRAYDEVLKSLAAQVQSARIREVQLRGEYNRALAKANQEGVNTTKLTTKKREIDTNRKLYDNYIQKQKEMELTGEISKPDNIKITSNSGGQGVAIGPDRNRNIILAFLVSLVGGIGLAFLLDYLDDSIRSSDDIGRSIGLPTLALIPHHSIEKKNSKALPTQLGSTSSALMVLEDNRSPTAEAYRHLRTSLLFSSAGEAPKKILVTSSQPSEGKTTTAINTAITLAQSGAKVVIIDCDLRRPRLHNHFNMENSFGLTNYLSGEKDTTKIIKDFDDVPNLKVVTSGPVPPNPAELLSSKQMKNFLNNLAGTFDHVIVDSPPAISFTDAAILSTHVDGVVLVAMSGKSSIHLMKRFKQRLGSMGAKIYGVVLNGIKPNSLDYSYYGYGYTYSYYENSDEDPTPMLEDDGSVELLEEEYIEEYEEYEDDEDAIHETK